MYYTARSTPLSYHGHTSLNIFSSSEPAIYIVGNITGARTSGPLFEIFKGPPIGDNIISNINYHW